MSVAKEQIRQIIVNNNLSSVADVYALLKDSFKDILQELMEAELDASLGYEKNHKVDLKTSNKRYGHSQKNSKASMVNFKLMFPETVTGSLNQSLSQNIRGIFPGLKKRCCPSMQGG